MTDTVWLGIIVGTPPTIVALTGLLVAWRTKQETKQTRQDLGAVAENVGKIERQTNSMNSQMVDSARKEGRIEGKERAEGVAAVTAANVAAAASIPALPILIRPADPADPNIAKWIQMGVDIEKARIAAGGNGPR